MARIKYDISDVDIQGGGDFTPAPVGLYRAKIVETTVGESKSGQPMLTVVLELTHDAKGKKLKDKYGRIWHRVPLEHWEDTAGWTFRLKELLDALGLKPKGSLDPDKLVDESLTVKLRSGKDLDDNYRPEVGKLMKVGDDEDDADEPDEDEPDEDDEDEDDDDEESEEYTEDDLNEMNADGLAEVAEELEVDVPAGKLTAAKKKKLIAALLEAQEAEDEDEEDEDEEDEDEEDEEQEDYSDWSRNQLIKEARSRGLKVKKSDDDDTIRGWLVAADEGDEEDEEEEDEDEEQDYTEWDLDQLKAECKERGLKSNGGAAVLAKRLTKDDESKEDPF